LIKRQRRLIIIPSEELRQTISGSMENSAYVFEYKVPHSEQKYPLIHFSTFRTRISKVKNELEI